MKWDTVYVTRPENGVVYTYGVPTFARRLFVRTLVLLALALPVWIVYFTILLTRAVFA